MSQSTGVPTNESSPLDAGERCLIALEDGRSFSGFSFGAPGTAVGELVFNTSLAGYQEILTDPSYAGQVVTLTYPEIGNYGTNDEDLESTSGQIHARALVVRHFSRRFSSWRATRSLSQFLQSQGVPAITGVDTRAITRHIREKGAMRCAVSTEILDPAELSSAAVAAPSMVGAFFSDQVTTKEIYTLGTGKFKVAVLDFGIKKNILEHLVNQDLSLTIYPASSSAETILAQRPHAIFLSPGPGDPQACTGILKQLPKIIEQRLPTFGICLGHQLLSIAFGAQTYKLKFGHRGGNHPVKDILTGKVEITAQNHGFAVDLATMPDCLELTHINLNDQSVEGFRHKELPVFGVQYHPESSPGPHDSNYLIERFFKLIESGRKASV